MMTTIVTSAKHRSDRSKKPAYHQYSPLTFEECMKLAKGGICIALDDHGNYFHVRITSVKTWKRRPYIEVHYKYGLYVYGYERVEPFTQQCFFVKEASHV
jgi:hypothetical protein